MRCYELHGGGRLRTICKAENETEARRILRPGPGEYVRLAPFVATRRARNRRDSLYLTSAFYNGWGWSE